jgi:hypothetical protein
LDQRVKSSLHLLEIIKLGFDAADYEAENIDEWQCGIGRMGEGALERGGHTAADLLSMAQPN